MFAQLQTVPPEFLKNFLLVVAGLLSGAGAVFGIMLKLRKQNREITPQPLEVKAATEFVRRQDCDAFKVQLERRLGELETERAAAREQIAADRAGAEQTARVRSAGIYNKIDEVRKELTAAHDTMRAEMTRNFQDTERALGRIEGKIDSIQR